MEKMAWVMLHSSRKKKAPPSTHSGRGELTPENVCFDFTCVQYCVHLCPQHTHMPRNGWNHFFCLSLVPCGTNQTFVLVSPGKTKYTTPSREKDKKKKKSVRGHLSETILFTSLAPWLFHHLILCQNRV